MRLFMLLALGLALLAAGMPFALADPVRKDDGPQFEYREDTKRDLGFVANFGDRSLGEFSGHLDAAGNFIPLLGFGPSSFYGQRAPINADPPGKPVYEFRSGMLIRGKFDRFQGNFVPEIGSEVIPFADYKYSKDAPRIYNLPGRFVEKKK